MAIILKSLETPGLRFKADLLCKLGSLCVYEFFLSSLLQPQLLHLLTQPQQKVLIHLLQLISLQRPLQELQ